MKKGFYIFLVFFLAVLKLQAQEDYIESDTSEYIPAFERDTNSRVHAGAIMGLHYRGLLYKENPALSDSIGNWSNTPHIGFSFGIVVDTRINQRLDFVSGFNIMISKLQMNYTFRGKDESFITSYSTLQLPLWLNYGLRKTPNRMYIGFGTILTTDISRRDEKLNRTITFNNFNMLIGAGIGYRKRLPTYFNLNFELQAHFSLINLIQNKDNFYNQVLNNMNIWEVSFYISLD